MRCAGSSDGTVTAPECAGRRFGRRYISNYYLKTLLHSWPHDCGDVLAEPLSPCHVDAALRVIDAAFPCFVLFDGGGGAEVAVEACSSPALKDATFELYYTKGAQPCEGKFKKLLADEAFPRLHGVSYAALFKGVRRDGTYDVPA